MHYLLESEQGLREFSGYINMARATKANLKSLRNMYGGDHWDQGRGYIGPLPIEQDPNMQMIMTNLNRQFTPRNVIKEVVDRAVDGLLGRSPDYKIYDRSKVVEKTLDEAEKKHELATRLEMANTSVANLLKDDPKADTATRPTVSEKALSEDEKKVAEAEIILSQLWTNADIPKILREVITEFMITGRALARVYVNKNFTRLDNVEERERLIESTKYVKAEFLKQEQVKIVEDEGELLSIVKINPNKQEQKVEISFVAEDGKTYIAVFTEDLPIEDKSAQSFNTSVIDDKGHEHQELDIAELTAITKRAEVSSPFSLDGNIIVGEVNGEAYITQPMIQQNRALNLDLSLAVGVLVESGYAEL